MSEMAIVFDKNNGNQVYRVACCFAEGATISRETICPDLNENDYGFFVTTVDVDVHKNPSWYHVDDTDPENPLLVAETIKKLVLECDAALNNGVFEKQKSGLVVLSAKLYDSEDNPVPFESGTVVRFECDRGNLDFLEKVAVGGEGNLDVNWTSVNETILANLRCYCVNQPRLGSDSLSIQLTN